MVDVKAWVVRVPKNQRKLYTTAPAVRNGVGVKAMLQVDGAVICVVAVRKQQYTPKIKIHRLVIERVS